jgi:hypothetical protein
VLLEQADRVKVGGWRERLVKNIDPANTVDPVGPAGVSGVGVAQQIPATMTHHQCPRVDLDVPFRPGLGSIVEPYSSPVGASLHERARRTGVGAGCAEVRRGRRAAAHCLGLGCHGLRQCPDDLPERVADRVGGIAGVVVAVEHGHHQAECLGGGEHQRGQA